MNITKALFRLLLGRRLPTTAGTIKVAGLKRPVTIGRDSFGVPYIEAENDADAWFGLGFCQGQDRAFQIESQLRVIRGTLAEVVGPEALPVDQLSRRIGFRLSAEEQLSLVDESIRRDIDAFAQGVNAGATLGSSRRAHEFSLLRSEPTQCQAADVLGLMKLMSFLLPSNWNLELVRLKILAEDGPEALLALEPAYPDQQPVTAPPAELAGKSIDRLAEDLTLFSSVAGHSGGSNNWVIASARTSSGRPILANDQHLASAHPAPYYLAHIRTPDWAVAGATFVGSPVFSAGHNGTAAWGVTAGYVDNTDLFVEEIGPDGKSVRQGDDFVPCQERVERILVKGSDTVEERVLVTPRGPIVGPALGDNLGAISLRALWLDALPLRGLFTLHKARSFETFRHSFEFWPALPLNIGYADSSDTIGWQIVGQAPVRRCGNGMLPLQGSNLDAGWENDPVPFNDMPYLANPEIGFVATANNKPQVDGAGPFLSADWPDGSRLARIVEVLNTRDDWNLESAFALQMDEASVTWPEIREAVLATPAGDADAKQALELLTAWDGVVSADSTGATVFEFFMAEMSSRMVVVKAPRAAEWALEKGFMPLTPLAFVYTHRWSLLMRLLQTQPESWFDRPWPDELSDALGAVVRNLRSRAGADPDNWRWGQLRPLTFKHAVGERAPLDRVFDLGPFPWGGDSHTVSQAAVFIKDPVANPGIVASMRMIVDVGNWEENRFVLPGGQSGNPLSPHYDDQLPLWRQGEGLTIAWSKEQVRRVTAETLTLSPAL